MTPETRFSKEYRSRAEAAVISEWTARRMRWQAKRDHLSDEEIAYWWHVSNEVDRICAAVEQGRRP